ncbi:phosphonoacetaldehyde reductase [Flavobacteriales bacterium]|nr:phosphonoacetaldehyde reductase [Flavobacteriales bacterium]
MDYTVRFEQEAVDCLQKDLESLNAKSIFLVTGKKSYESSGSQALIEDIEDRYKFIRFQDFEDNPNIEDVVKGVKLFKESATNVIMAIGGGSVIDMAKLIKFFNNKAEPFINQFNTRIKDSENIPLIVIPTTAGTGSESTHFAVLYVGMNKYSIADSLLLPNHVAIISKLTLSQSAYQKAVSGIDSFSQAIESYWSVQSTQESREYSLDALKLIIPSLPLVVNGDNQDAHEKMALGAFLAGKAINIAKTTAPHAFSYYLTKRFSLPHGHAVAVFLPSFIAYNFHLNSDKINFKDSPNLKDLKILLQQLLGENNNLRIDKSVSQFISSIGIQLNLEVLSLERKDIVSALKSGNKERLKNNPRDFDYDSFIRETDIIDYVI